MRSLNPGQQVVMANCVNADDKSTATQTVRSGGFVWLKPIAMFVVNCNRAEVVECCV